MKAGWMPMLTDTPFTPYLTKSTEIEPSQPFSLHLPSNSAPDGSPSRRKKLKETVIQLRRPIKTCEHWKKPSVILRRPYEAVKIEMRVDSWNATIESIPQSKLMESMSNHDSFTYHDSFFGCSIMSQEQTTKTRYFGMPQGAFSKLWDSFPHDLAATTAVESRTFTNMHSTNESILSSTLDIITLMFLPVVRLWHHLLKLYLGISPWPCKINFRTQHHDQFLFVSITHLRAPVLPLPPKPGWYCCPTQYYDPLLFGAAFHKVMDNLCVRVLFCFFSSPGPRMPEWKVKVHG